MVKKAEKPKAVKSKAGSGIPGSKPLRNPKEELFCHEYTIDKNAAKAGVRASYAKSTAEKKAPAWVAKSREKSTKPHIWDRVQFLLSKVVKEVDITAERTLKEIALLAFSNMGELIEQDKDGVVSMKWLDQLSPEQLACVSEISEYETERGRRRFRFKLHSKTDALEMLAKHYKLLTEKVEHGFTEGCGVLAVPIGMSKEQWSKFAKQNQIEK